MKIAILNSCCQELSLRFSHSNLIHLRLRTELMVLLCIKLCPRVYIRSTPLEISSAGKIYSFVTNLQHSGSEFVTNFFQKFSTDVIITDCYCSFQLKEGFHQKTTWESLTAIVRVTLWFGFLLCGNHLKTGYFAEILGKSNSKQISYRKFGYRSIKL